MQDQTHTAAMASILVGPRFLTIHYYDTMLVTSPQGWIEDPLSGLFSRDTRYISNYRLTLNGFDLRFLGASQPYYFATTHHFTNPRLGAGPESIAENSLVVRVSRYVRQGVHEDITVTNYAGRTVDLSLALHIGTDFADIFQVRGVERVIPRLAQARWDQADNRLTVTYRRGTFLRTLIIRFNETSTPPGHSAGAVAFRFRLAPGASWESCADIMLEELHESGHPKRETLPVAATDYRGWQAATTRVQTPNRLVAQSYDQAIADLGSLRLEEVDGYWYPAAGLPWFMAVFGRDALLTALEAIIAHPRFGVGVLERLAQLQGKKVDRWTEEEPGKLPHELRRGELAATGKIPHIPYYGTVDAPLLYPILLYEVYAFTADRGLLERFYGPAAGCLEWAARYGDIDGDGFIEYRPRSPKGYRNQGWKDAFDAVVYPDGRLVEPPIAICEVQGYYYDALRRMAAIARLLNHADEAAEYSRRATDLYARFNQAYWWEAEGFYAMGLGPHKEPIWSVASNPGHLLWSGIVPPERAAQLAQRLMSEDMFSGWGIRTLSAAHPAYDPVSYQRGSVWPHDNSLIALGLKRYGFWQEANRVAQGLFEAAAFYAHTTLPELFAGIARSPGDLPVPYADANSPQAWAAASVPMFLRAVLGLEVDPSGPRLYAAPTLPEWLPEVTLSNFLVCGDWLDLRFRGQGPDTAVEILRSGGRVQVVARRGNARVDPMHSEQEASRQG